jgi:hypothetical protein
MTKEMTIEERMKEENQVRDKIDEKGGQWRKLHFGGRAHSRNWLEQCKEIYGEEDVEIEEMTPDGFKCFEEGGGNIWNLGRGTRGGGNIVPCFRRGEVFTLDGGGGNANL